MAHADRESSLDERRGSRVSRRRLSRLGCIILPVLLTVAVYISYRLSAARAERALDAEIGRLRAAGIIVPIADLLPTVPPGERNAADVYRQAFAAFQPVSAADEEVLFPHPSESRRPAWDAPSRLSVLIPAVEQNATYFSLLDEAAALPHCAFSIARVDLRNPDAERVGSSRLNDAARWQGIRAEAFLATGDPDAALRCVGAVLRIAEHQQRDHSEIAQVHAYGVQFRAAEVIQTTISIAEPSVEACRELLTRLARVDNKGTFATALKRTLAVRDLPLLQQLRNHEYTPVDLGTSLCTCTPVSRLDQLDLYRYTLPGDPALAQDAIIWLRYRENLIHAYSVPWPGIRDAHAEASAEIASSRMLWYVLGSGCKNAGIGPSLGVAVARDRATARLRAAQVALAVAIYRAEHGRYPASTSDLAADGWDLPDDPFGGGPLHFRLEPNGFVVWSVGPNLRDDGAVRYGPPMSYEDGPYDIVFRVTRGGSAQPG